jgi:multidrug efflux pump subunit AcrB
LIKFFQKQHVFVNLLTLMIIGAGLYYVFTLKRDAFPEITGNFAMVQVVYPGASPEEIERLIAIPIEDAIAGVDGLDKMDSYSNESVMMLWCQLDESLSDEEIEDAIDDIRREVDRVKDLPEQADDPIVGGWNTKDTPLINISISGDLPEIELRRWCRRFEDEAKMLKGVGKIQKSGYRQRQVWVEADPLKLARHHLSLTDLMGVLRARNMNFPSGKIKEGEREILLRTMGEFADLQEIKDVVLRTADNGNLVRLSDVATVKDDFEESRIYARINGDRSINMFVFKKQVADAINTVESLRELVQRYEQEILPAGVKLTLTDDVSFYVKRRLNVLTMNGLTGLCLVVVLLLLFLDWRLAWMTSLGLVVAFLLAIIAVNWFGYTINLITMFGFIIVLGMLVDDAIVVAESIFRHLEKGKDLATAAYIGTQEVILPVTAAICTTIAAFLPLFLISGIMGKFLGRIPAVVTISLIASIMEAFFILPSHIISIGRLTMMGSGKTLKSKAGSAFDKLRDRYLILLDRVLTWRWLFVPLVGVVFILSLVFAFKQMKFELFPQGLIDQFMVRVETNRNSTLEQTARIVDLVEREVMTLEDGELDAAIADIGQSGMEETQRAGSNLAQVRVFLWPAQDRVKAGLRTTDQVIDYLRPLVDKIEGIEKVTYEKAHGGPPTGMPIDIKVKGKDLSLLRQAAAEIREYLAAIKGVDDVHDTYAEGKEELRLTVDDAKAAYAGVNVGLVAQNLRYAVDGGQATDMRWEDEDVDVVVKLNEATRNSRKVLDAVKVPNMRGSLVKLSRLVKTEQTSGQASIHRSERMRTLNVRASNIDVKQGVTSDSVNRLLVEEFQDTIPDKYPGVVLDFSGEFEQQQDSQKSIGRAFAIGLAIVYLILATSFRSMMQPFIIILAVPYGLIGVIIGLYLNGYSLSMMALIGATALTGIVVNNSLILVDYINRERQAGLGRRKSIISACRVRMRPVVLTSLTTVCGLAPTAYGIGGAEPFVQPCAMTIVWGLAFASVLTLFLIPATCAISDDIDRRMLEPVRNFWVRLIKRRFSGQ